MNLNPLTFQYLIRGNRLAELDGQMLAAAIEQRDRELEDFLGDLSTPATWASGSEAGPFSGLPRRTTFGPFPGAGPGRSLTLDKAHTALVILSAYVDSGINNNDITLAIDLSGATVVPAGMYPDQELRVGGRQFVSSTVGVTYMQPLAAGTTTFQLQYIASLDGADVSNVALRMVAVS